MIFKPRRGTDDEIRKRLDRSEASEWTVHSNPSTNGDTRWWPRIRKRTLPPSSVRMEVIVVSCVLLVSLLVVFSQYFLVRMFVVSPVGRLTHMIQNIAEGEGDVTKRLEVAGAFGNDELGEVGRLFNMFMDKLQEILRGRRVPHA